MGIDKSAGRLRLAAAVDDKDKPIPRILPAFVQPQSIFPLKRRIYMLVIGRVSACNEIIDHRRTTLCIRHAHGDTVLWGAVIVDHTLDARIPGGGAGVS